ncbi:hypothetical protein [Hymenobacter latericus]|uniref:hypothetical protein n=1 Tax=Hymenobacter sp. YIM 151858-1 TaxID=2987688 RepID=UPI0022272849|nr:hypothetical protein [Hymenobacter sp. YIM 151858-1]UYZ60326.1 hypothetical protein OIS50_05885 [Hymenobacter sp. YIM 151858-1]
MSIFKRSLDRLINKADILKLKNTLTDTQWLLLSQEQEKTVYSFLDDKRLVISINGEGTSGKWEFIVDNDTLVIETISINVFNCYMISDDFLILHKDNDLNFNILANLSKHKNNAKDNLLNNFYNKYFSKINSTTDSQKLYAIKVHEINELIKDGKNKKRTARAIQKMVYDAQSAQLFNHTFQQIFGTKIADNLNNSNFTPSEAYEIAEPLINFGIIKRRR